MKTKIVFFLPLTLISMIVLLSPGSERKFVQTTPFVAPAALESLLNKFSVQINKSSTSKTPTKAVVNNDKTIRAFWNEMFLAYEYLRMRGAAFRYPFMHGAVQLWAAATGDELNKKLKIWSQKESRRRITEEGISPSRWQQHLTAIDKAIDGLSDAKLDNSIVVNTNADRELLLMLVKDLKAIKPETKKLSYSTKSEDIDLRNSTHVTILYLLALGLGFAFSHLLKDKLATVTATPEATPAEVSVVPESKKIHVAKESGKELTNIADALEDVMASEGHLFKVANIDTRMSYLTQRNNFITMPSRDLKDSLANLLKGTLSLVDSSVKNTSLIEWGCQNREDRIEVFFHVRNIKFSREDFERNTLLMGEGAAPLYFSKAESALALHLPLVSVDGQIQDGSRVILSLEASQSMS
jgi:hypothetical protein